ncbi:6-bladed beta-propeller [Parabacteroides distasonis]|uniref:6-bladed beta-propeller n=1 Tax=Parabacteroides distasonis TaxID=823 RepID=UPI0004DA6A50|nr:6-bladed beta-propeller [Parabacteroides distasonis]KDS59070.1 putative lipoprotein [Parabacteroides distasonis str. 3999B T(B) 4]KDS74804.1 putative lipoprotein [Parabacteroides distasonis str. 3999B T(B) 6]
MRKLYYLVMISLASILIACENRSEEWDVVDFGNDCTVGLQEHLECRFIPLETKDSVLLKDLYRVCWVDDRIFVFDRSDEINALFVFSDQGNFITRVGLRGQGPEEYLYLTSNPQPIGFSGILVAKRQNSFYCTYFLHNRNVADTKSPYPIKRLEVIRWFNQKSMVFNQSLS